MQNVKKKKKNQPNLSSHRHPHRTLSFVDHLRTFLLQIVTSSTGRCVAATKQKSVTQQPSKELFSLCTTLLAGIFRSNSRHKLETTSHFSIQVIYAHFVLNGFLFVTPSCCVLFFCNGMMVCRLEIWRRPLLISLNNLCNLRRDKNITGVDWRKC